VRAFCRPAAAGRGAAASAPSDDDVVAGGRRAFLIFARRMPAVGGDCTRSAQVLRRSRAAGPVGGDYGAWVGRLCGGFGEPSPCRLQGTDIALLLVFRYRVVIALNPKI
jgi:hypothetical protein